MNRVEAAAAARAAKKEKQPSLHDRFWSKVDIRGADECWPWTAAKRRKDQGYGAFWLNGKHQPSNRVAWILTYGEIQDNEMACHSCDNQSCCNPKHLFLGTHLENMDDMVKKGRQSKGEKNGLSKLTESQIKEIKAAKLDGGEEGRGDLKRKLALKYNVKPGTIVDVWMRSWRHVI